MPQIFNHFHIRFIIPTFFILALLGTPSSALAEDSKTGKNALILQADFSGLVMTGVAYTVSKDLDVYNIRPLIPLYDIKAASASLAYNAQTWPAGTVFVSVVDPGVGTARKSVVLKTKNGLYFVSPDNGSLYGPASDYGIEAVREIDEQVNRRKDTDWAHTFHGRDVYSYTGARLAAGVISFAQVGPLLASKVIQLDVLSSAYKNGVLSGFVSGGTGRLGNIEFSIDRHLFEETKAAHGDIFDAVIKHRGEVVWRGNLPYSKSFGDVAIGENLLFINSSGVLSIAINQGNFAEENAIGYGRDWSIELRKQQPGAGVKFRSIDTSISSRDIKIPVTYVEPFAKAGSIFPLVVMAHGHGGTRNEAGGFTRVAEDLARLGVASIRMDFSGCGDSKESFANNNLGNMLSDIQASRDFALKNMQVDKARVGLLGFSMGGRLAMLLTEHDKSYSVMATWAPAGENGAHSMIDFVGGIDAYNALKQRATDEGFAPFTTRWGQKQKLGVQWFTDMEQSKPLEAVKGFSGDFLVLHGDQDAVISPKVTNAVVAAASNSRNVVHHVIAGGDHGLGLFSDNLRVTDDAVNTTVSFLKQHL